ncbi:signal recognition particle 19 kDa protein [Egretta garzetta]|nr:signal recognition particle 19 kDa protein [Egretta garzetta]
MAFAYIQRWKLHHLAGQPVLALGHPHSEKVLPDIQREPPVPHSVPIASGPGTGHHRKEPGSILSAPSPQVFIHIGRAVRSLLYRPVPFKARKRFICIYPAYLNNKKTIAEGRRIPIDKAVENPTSTEIQDVCAAVGFNVLLEKNKMYPREWNRDVQYRGRVRIQLKQDDGSPCLPQFPTRKSVMLYAAETIPKLKTRTQKMGGSDQSLQQGEGGKKGKGKKKK